MRINPASLPVSKLLAGAGAIGMLGAIGVFGVRDVNAATCWSGTKNITPRLVQPGHFDVPLPYIASAAQIRGHSADPWTKMWKNTWVRQAVEFDGDDVVGPADWMSYGGHAYPTLHEDNGVLLAYSKSDPNAVGLYGWQDEDNHQYWLYETGSASQLALKNHYALAFTFTGGELRIMGMDAKSGHQSWCRQVKGAGATPGATVPAGRPNAVPWFSTETGDSRSVLYVTRSPRATPTEPITTVSDIDIKTGASRWSRDIPGQWDQVLGGQGRVYLLGNRDGHPSLAALHASDGSTLWQQPELPTPEDAPSASRVTQASFVGLAQGRLLLATTARGGATINAYDLDGKPQWALPADPQRPAAETILAGDRILMPATRSDGRGVAAYRISDARQLWFSSFATTPSLAAGAADDSRVYLPSPHGPVILTLAAGARVPTKLTLPSDVVLISAGRLVIEKAMPGSSFDEVVAYQTPDDSKTKSQTVDTTVNGQDGVKRGTGN